MFTCARVCVRVLCEGLCVSMCARGDVCVCAPVCV